MSRSFEFVKNYSEKGFNPNIPEYQTKHSAGADFFCAKTVVVPSLWELAAKALVSKAEGIFLKDTPSVKIEPTVVHTGIKADMYEDEVLELYNRSSNPKKKGLIMANSVGIIDADYYSNPDNDGEIMFAFYNLLPYAVVIEEGERIGQGIFKKFLRPEHNLKVKDADRVGGFGSTSK